MTATHAIEFSVAIHSGFRVGAAYGRDGVDLAVDVEDPLPATHLKGIMRASAVELVTLLDVAPELFDVVFGSVAMPSSWSWSGARPRAGAEWTVSTRHRVEIDPVAGAARKDHLVRAHRVDTRAATFAVHRLHGDSDGTFGGLAAEEALLDRALMVVGVQAYREFVKRLDQPARPNLRLQRTMQSEAPWRKA